MKKIILDTNFLMIPAKFGVDIFSEIGRICSFNYELCIFKGTIAELEKIVSSQPLKDRMAAQLSLKLLSAKNIRLLDSKQKDVDDSILEIAGEDAIIATLDIELKRRLLEKGAAVIVLRQKKYLKIYGFV